MPEKVKEEKKKEGKVTPKRDVRKLLGEKLSKEVEMRNKSLKDARKLRNGTKDKAKLKELKKLVNKNRKLLREVTGKIIVKLGIKPEELKTAFDLSINLEAKEQKDIQVRLKKEGK